MARIFEKPGVCKVEGDTEAPQVLLTTYTAEGEIARSEMLGADELGELLVGLLSFVVGFHPLVLEKVAPRMLGTRGVELTAAILATMKEHDPDQIADTMVRFAEMVGVARGRGSGAGD